MWLVLLVAALVGVIYFGNTKLQERKAAAAKSEAVASHATGTVAAAVETAKAGRKAEDDTPLPADKKAIFDLCSKSASCRERGQK
jgi:hypothetical protein